eukprot:TRINITY_DN66286_c6_g7_i1.p1 TRINITY_DN66286_c6_g7~~TRINITY_DN66286_c6_g7_i1.p1  ORF type:complete len:336 (-),score=58.43 TRINITY_DN66286_c6_g7_i1:136-1143(-)
MEQALVAVPSPYCPFCSAMQVKCESAVERYNKWRRFEKKQQLVIKALEKQNEQEHTVAKLTTELHLAQEENKKIKADCQAKGTRIQRLSLENGDLQHRLTEIIGGYNALHQHTQLLLQQLQVHMSTQRKSAASVPPSRSLQGAQPATGGSLTPAAGNRHAHVIDPVVGQQQDTLHRSSATTGGTNNAPPSATSSTCPPNTATTTATTQPTALTGSGTQQPNNNSAGGAPPPGSAQQHQNTTTQTTQQPQQPQQTSNVAQCYHDGQLKPLLAEMDQLRRSNAEIQKLLKETQECHNAEMRVLTEKYSQAKQLNSLLEQRISGLQFELAGLKEKVPR